MNGSVGSIKSITVESVYYATKVTIRSFSRSWYVELKERHIQVNTVSPDPIDESGLKRVAKNDGEEKSLINFVTNATVMEQLGTPDKIVKAVVFLASDSSKLRRRYRTFCRWRLRTSLI